MVTPASEPQHENIVKLYTLELFVYESSNLFWKLENNSENFKAVGYIKVL